MDICLRRVPLACRARLATRAPKDTWASQARKEELKEKIFRGKKISESLDTDC